MDLCSDYEWREEIEGILELLLLGVKELFVYELEAALGRRVSLEEMGVRGPRIVEW